MLMKGHPLMNLPEIRENSSARRSWSLRLACAVALAAASAGSSFAQVKTPAPAAASASAGAAAAAAVSPEQQLEDKLMSSMASREMTSLLEYYFKANNIAPERQTNVKSIVAWNQLK